MARSGQEIQAALRTFAKKWQTYDGTETAEAQTFLNELCASYRSDRRRAVRFRATIVDGDEESTTAA